MGRQRQALSENDQCSFVCGPGYSTRCKAKQPFVAPIRLGFLVLVFLKCTVLKEPQGTPQPRGFVNVV